MGNPMNDPIVGLTLLESLRWAQTTGAAAIALFFVSILAEKSAWFQKLESKDRFRVFLGLVVTVALAAWGIVTYVPPVMLQALEAPFAVLMTALTLAVSVETFHKVTRDRKPTTQNITVNAEYASAGTVNVADVADDMKALETMAKV